MRESKIEEKTLLVIGAGASVDFSHNNGVDLKEHFAFPSGEELLERLKNPVISGFTFTEEFVTEYKKNTPPTLSNLDTNPIFCIDWCKYHIGFISEAEKKEIYNYYVYDKNRMSAITGFQDINNLYYCRQHVIVEYFHQADGSERILPLHHKIALDQLLIHLLNLHKPLSIDYYISNNLKSHITEEHLKNAKRLELILDNKLIETKEDLEKAVEKHAINKITHILRNCKVENLQNGYFANILCNYITLDKIQNLEIITFNYDLILEQTIEYLIEKNEEPERKDELKELKNRIIHVYGDIDKGITFIRNIEKDKKIYKDLFNKAKSIYFLGFGFDETNLKNLGTDKGFKGQKERLVFITNFSKLPKLEYTVERAFKCKFEFVREGSRKCYKGKKYFIIAEKSITQSLKGDFFFL